MNKEVASEVNALLRVCSARIDESVAVVKEKCDEADFIRYRRAASKVLGELYCEVLEPMIWGPYPDLQPEALKKE